MTKKNHKAIHKKRTATLGMSYGTAVYRLQRSVLFDLVKRLGLNVCFRCAGPIGNIEDFTLEHKKSWRVSATPTETFLDLKNIAFSHSKCNSTAVFRPPIQHGTRKGFRRGCRCTPCSSAAKRYTRDYIAKWRAEGRDKSRPLKVGRPSRN